MNTHFLPILVILRIGQDHAIPLPCLCQHLADGQSNILSVTLTINHPRNHYIFTIYWKLIEHFITTASLKCLIMVSGTRHKTWLEIEHLISFRETQLTAIHTYTVEISETPKNEKINYEHLLHNEPLFYGKGRRCNSFVL